MPKIQKKSLGQNFLRDPKILEKIANAAEIKNTDTVIEVGPGEGTLTKFLLERALKVISIEKDDTLIPYLEKKFQKEIESGQFILLNQDILDFSLRNFLKETYVLVGNIPYYITGEIFRKFLEIQDQPKSLTFVVQKEVAERIVERGGKGSVLSNAIKSYGEPEYGGLIKAGSFSPAPSVDSAIISVRNISKKRFEEKGIDEKFFFQLLKKGFAHKRKFLLRNLEVKGIESIFEKLGIPKDIRAEDVSVDDWFAIINACQAVAS